MYIILIGGPAGRGVRLRQKLLCLRSALHSKRSVGTVSNRPRPLNGVRVGPYRPRSLMPTQPNSSVAEPVRDFDSLKRTILPFQTASVRRAVWQLLNSCLPYLFLWYVMYRLLF